MGCKGKGKKKRQRHTFTYTCRTADRIEEHIIQKKKSLTDVNRIPRGYIFFLMKLLV